MFSPEIIGHAKAVGVTPEAFAARVDIAMATGQSRAEAMATAYLELAAPGFNASAAFCVDSEQTEEDAVCERDIDIPAPWNLTEPEEMYAESVKNLRLQESKMRLRNSTKGEQGSQRGPLHDGKEDA